MTWGQVDAFNGKYINNIIPISGGKFDIIYADEYNYGVRSVIIDNKREIDHRVISYEEYKSHYIMFRRHDLI